MSTMAEATVASPETVVEWLDTLEPVDRADMEKVLAAVSMGADLNGWQDTYEDWVRYEGVLDTGDYGDIARALDRGGVQVVLVHDPDAGWVGFQAEAEVDQGAFLLVQFHSIEDLALTRDAASGPGQVLWAVRQFRDAMDTVAYRYAEANHTTHGITEED